MQGYGLNPKGPVCMVCRKVTSPYLSNLAVVVCGLAGLQACLQSHSPCILSLAYFYNIDAQQSQGLSLTVLKGLHLSATIFEACFLPLLLRCLFC